MTENKKKNQEAIQKLETVIDSVEGDWVLVRCYSKRERSVKDNIENRVVSLGLTDSIFEVVLLEENVIQIVNGIKKTVVRSRIPGHLLVRMDVYDKDSVAELRKVNGVIDYVGGVHEPIPLTREELMKILVPLVSNIVETTEDVVKYYSRPDVSVGVKTGGAKIEVDFVIGDFIRIDGGPFNDMNGTITTINLEHERVQVLLSLFGRETTVELSLNQVVKEKQS